MIIIYIASRLICMDWRFWLPQALRLSESVKG